MENTYRYTEYPLERAGIALHLDCVTLEGASPEKNILLTHGVTYSSQEFDLDYLDYSLVRLLAREGWAVWRLDIAGYGRSGPVADGFLPDSFYAAEDIRAAVERIVSETGREKIDLLGWSWGTVTAARYAVTAPERLNRLVLYAPILCGVGAAEVAEPFHRNSLTHAAEDFQRGSDGLPDPAVTDPAVVELYCEGCLRYDGETSPNAGRREICVEPARSLIELEKIQTPTLILCGDSDPYLNYERVGEAAEKLPAGSQVSVIPGGGHAVMLEKPYYHDFQARLMAFLRGAARPDKERIAFCGVDCVACADFAGGRCPGCRRTAWPEGDACLPVACCAEKGIAFCGECEGFPCAEMAAFYRESESHARAGERMRAMRT